MLRPGSTILVLTMAACAIYDDPGVVYGPKDTMDQGDTVPPVIEHSPVEAAQTLGQDVDLLATVTDDESGVFVVQVFYRQETSSMWEDVVLLDLDGDGLFEGDIPGSDVMTGGMYYYIYAMDTRENETQMPEEGESDPWHFRISPDDG